ncbi:uncharacterized protein [Antedon mediterranea]|uniref:uncharacterized protein n=1 Tax=Antedon mediterranea TaxID=105859 RepID=UPI003AF98B7B
MVSGLLLVLLVASISSCNSQKCSLSNTCYKSRERVWGKFEKEVCVCPFASCISTTNPCPGIVNIQFDGIAIGTEITPGIFEEWGELNALSIHQGPPVNITQDLFKSQRPHLKILELDTFSIENIEVGAFGGFRKLEILDIRPYKVNIIRRNTFRGLSMLQVLKLYSGNVSVIHPGAFNGLDRLKRLWVSNNKITHIRKGVFDNLVALEELRMSFNHIHRIDPFAFSKLQNLKTLECWDTKMQTLTPEMLNGLESVRNLNFGKNFINMIENGTFSEMENLEHLILSKNNLTSFSLIDLYLPLPSLLTLDLKSNQIDNILLPTNFSEPLLTNLTKFVLNGNKLAAVPRFLLDYAPDINSAYAPVPNSCDCFEVSNVTDPYDEISLIPSMSCPHTCTIPTVDCTPTHIDLNDIREMPHIIITCNVTGNPTPSVTWKQPNGRIILGDYNPWDRETNLYLSDIKMSDLGTYTCHVESRAGIAQSLTTINLLTSSSKQILPNCILLLITIFQITINFV